ncbi:hypothetical protein FE782_15660 [Paenibacillus antri]|uniref:Uncharacterized protein n=1 Tax=Paenibacillus antri TaxID=2582848 RepID=A0A5R9G480_9BACL|nr:YwmB family TATA-box binding protein [Paenibacillus antri]TLS51172.1 hypothetical protein FE782_15660 [Paenibacillus antri]
MKRFAGWMAGAALALICAAGLGGWMPAFAANVSSGSPADDAARLDALANGRIAEDGRLWVVGVRTPGGLERWSGDDAAEAIRWIERRQAALDGKDADWFVNVQGTLVPADVQAVWPRLADAAGAALVEGYEDGTTFSYSYRAPSFSASVGEGDGAINFMAAAHLDTETGLWRMTLGTPVVMIEY